MCRIWNYFAKSVNCMAWLTWCHSFRCHSMWRHSFRISIFICLASTDESTENVCPNDQTIKIVKLRRYDIKVKPSGSTVMMPSEKRNHRLVDSPNKSTLVSTFMSTPKRRCAGNDNANGTFDSLSNLSLNLDALSPGAIDEINAEMENMTELPSNLLDSIVS